MAFDIYMKISSLAHLLSHLSGFVVTQFDTLFKKCLLLFAHLRGKRVFMNSLSIILLLFLSICLDCRNSCINLGPLSHNLRQMGVIWKKYIEIFLPSVNTLSKGLWNMPLPFGLKLKRTRRYTVSSKSCLVTRIQLLNGEFVEYTLSVEGTGQECLEAVAQRLELREVSIVLMCYSWTESLCPPHLMTVVFMLSTVQLNKMNEQVSETECAGTVNHHRASLPQQIGLDSCTASMHGTK